MGHHDSSRGAPYRWVKGSTEGEQFNVSPPGSPSHGPAFETDSGAFFKVATILLGLAVAVVGFALLMWADAHESREGNGGRPGRGRASHGAQHSAAAERLRRRRAGERPGPRRGASPDARLPQVPVGDLVKVQMTLTDMTVEIAPGVKYNTWAFDGHGAPGPIINVLEGQTVQMTLTNGGAIPHSIDFHAARIAPDQRSAMQCRASRSHSSS